MMLRSVKLFVLGMVFGLAAAVCGFVAGDTLSLGGAMLVLAAFFLGGTFMSSYERQDGLLFPLRGSPRGTGKHGS